MKHLLIVLITMLISIAIHAQDTTYTPEKGGMKLYEFDNRFTVSDSAQRTATFQFADGTDVKYDFRNHNKHKANKIKKLMSLHGYVTVRVGGPSLNKNRYIWRIYKYNK